MKKLLVKLIEFYQVYLSFDHGILSIFAPGGACKYDPACSQYTKQAVLKHGVIKGIRLGLKRIWRCR